MPKTYIIIPAFNEGPRIYSVLKSIKNSSALAKINPTIVVVDDASSDNTYQEARKAGVIVLRHIVNRGQGAALITGNQYALQRGADFIMHFDADGQHQPDAIEKFINRLSHDDMDMVLGSRFIESMEKVNSLSSNNNLAKIFSTIYGGIFLVKDIKLLRRIFLIGNFIVNTFITGVILTDGHNGLRAFTRSTALKIQLVQDRYAHPTEYTTEIKRLNLKYCELQVTVRYDITKKSQGFFDALVILKELFLGKSIKP